MAIVIFKNLKEDNKPKKEFVDLSKSHKKHKELHQMYKIGFFSILSLDIIVGLLYIILK